MTSDSNNVPGWLQNTDDDGKRDEENGASNAGGSAKDSLEMEDTNKNIAKTESGHAQRGGRCFLWMTSIVSLFFLVIFVISAFFQGNDTDGRGVVWWIFYALHAVLAACCLCLRWAKCVVCIEKPVQLLSGLMVVYSIVLIAISAKKVSDATTSAPGGDSEAFNDKEEKTLELSGASLGLASAIFHIILWKCAGGGKRAGSANDTEE